MKIFCCNRKKVLQLHFTHHAVLITSWCKALSIYPKLIKLMNQPAVYNFGCKLTENTMTPNLVHEHISI